MSVTRPRGLLLAMVSAIALAACGPQQPVAAKDPNPNAGAEIAKFLDAEIKDLSTLDRAAQEAELNWFATAAAPYQGMEITVVSENISTHEYESRVLAPAFSAITGIKVTHELIGEGDVVAKLEQQMQSGQNIYDAYINDSDLIGTHWRYQQVRNLTDWMAGEGKAVTSPTLDIADFVGFTRANEERRIRTATFASDAGNGLSPG